MLVLSRRKEEDIIFLGLRIRIKVLEIRGDKVWLGIDAPPDVRVLRRELLTREELEREGQIANGK